MRRLILPDAIRHNISIPVIIVAIFRPRQECINICWSADSQFRPAELLGGVIRRDHWAAEIPTALDIEINLEAEATGFTQCVPIKRTPFWRKESGAVRHRVVALLTGTTGINDHRPAKTLGLHFFQVLRNRRLGDVPV